MATSPAFTFVLVMGLVNFFGDVTYEGGASINGQYLGTLGATAAAISIIAGVGEFLGYSLRSVSGYVADKSGVIGSSPPVPTPDSSCHNTADSTRFPFGERR